MALPATGVLEVRTAGADTNGGGFVAGGTGTDWSQQNAAQYSVTDGVTAGTTTITSVTAAFGTDVVDNYIYVQGGTGALTAVWRRIVSRTNATTIVVDAATGLGASTGVTLNIGGALATLAQAALVNVAGNDIHVKSGTYAPVTVSVAGGSGTPIRWFGYDATRGDKPLGTGRPLIDAAGAAANCISIGAVTGNQFHRFRLSGGTAANFDQTTGFSACFQVKSSGSSAEGFKSTTTGTLLLTACEASGNAGAGVAVGSSSLVLDSCYIHDNTTNGAAVTSASNVSIVNSIVEANGATGVAIAAFIYFSFVGNTIDGNTGATSDGLNVNFSSPRPWVCHSNLATSNGRYGFARSAATVAIAAVFDYNGYYGNATADLLNIVAGANDAVGVDPGYTNAAAGDFSIAATLAESGYPGVFPGGLTTGYTPMGAVGRQAGAGAASMLRHPGMEGGCAA